MPLVASARLGKGRIVAFGHDGYFNREALAKLDGGKLVANAARWAGGRQGAKAGLIALPELASHLKKAGFSTSDATLDDDLARYDLLALKPTHLTPSQIKSLRAFVENGGGLLVAVTGWGWQQGSNRPMHELAGNQLLADTGIAWTNGFAEKTIPDGYRAGGDVSTLLNAHVALERLGAAKLPRKDVAQATSSLLLTLRTLPPDETEFHGRVRQLLRTGASPTPWRRRDIRCVPTRRYDGLPWPSRRNRPPPRRSTRSARCPPRATSPARCPPTLLVSLARSPSTHQCPIGIAWAFMPLPVRRSR